MEFAGVSLPRVLGHENAGWVEEVGSGVSTVAKGDAVLVYPPWSCGLCLACRRGNDMHCARHEFTGLSVDGGFADYVLVSERSLLPLPAGVEPAAVAPHADAGLTAYHAVRRAGAPRRAGHDGGRARGGRRRAHRPAAGARARVERGHRRRHRRAPPAARRRARCGRGDRRRRCGRRGRGADAAVAAPTWSSTSSAPTRRTPTRSAMLARGGTYSVIGYGGIDLDPVRRPRRERARGRRESGRHLGRPLRAPAAARSRPDHAQDPDLSAGFGERGARHAPRRRDHRPRSARPLKKQPVGVAWSGRAWRRRCVRGHRVATPRSLRGLDARMMAGRVDAVDVDATGGGRVRDPEGKAEASAATRRDSSRRWRRCADRSRRPEQGSQRSDRRRRASVRRWTS